MPIIVDKDKKRREILQAAMQVFAQDGYHRAKMETVAEEAGIGKGTVYEYFKSKADLFLALHQHMLTELKSFYLKELSEIRKPTLMLERFIAVAFETFRAWEPFFSGVFLTSGPRAEEGSRKHFSGPRCAKPMPMLERMSPPSSTLALTTDPFGKLIRPLTAASILASLDGLVLQWLCDRTAFDLDLMRMNLIESTLRSLRS